MGQKTKKSFEVWIQSSQRNKINQSRVDYCATLSERVWRLTMDDVIFKIESALNRAQNERELKKANTGYNVQYCPCGHFREVQWNEFALVERAKSNKNLDAIILHSSECPICKEEQW
jgi:hypothetical protein